MKEIRLLKSARIHIGAQPVDVGAAIERHRQCSRNGMEILASSLALERNMCLALSFFLLGPDSEKRRFLDMNILNSDWCSFSAKRKLIRSMMGTNGEYTPADVEEFDTAMSKVMRYRNAFAHGEVSSENAGEYLTYFEGQAVRKLLDDAYWDGVTAAFEGAHTKMSALLERIGAIQPAQPTVA